MLRYICSLLMLFAFVQLSTLRLVYGAELYWTFEQYSQKYPHQRGQSELFIQQVNEPGRLYAGDQEVPVRVAIVYPGEQVSDYWRRSVSAFEARLRESHVPYVIHVYFSKPGNQLTRQEEQINLALEQSPDYLIFTLDAHKHQVTIEQLISRIKPKVLLQNITTPLKRWGNTQPFFYVGFDHAEGSRIIAKQYLKLTGQKGRYAIFYGTNGYVSKRRGGSFKQLMAQYPEIELVAEFYTGFNRERAKAAALTLLQEDRSINFIFSSSTDIALGVSDAIKQKKLSGQVITNGWGGGSDELAAIEKSDLAMTVMRMNDDNGVAMAEAILQDKQSVKSVPLVYQGQLQLVVKEMGKDKVQSYTQRAFRYSDHWSSEIGSVLRSEQP